MSLPGLAPYASWLDMKMSQQLLFGKLCLSSYYLKPICWLSGALDSERFVCVHEPISQVVHLH